jgi:hypothetical protein
MQATTTAPAAPAAPETPAPQAVSTPSAITTTTSDGRTIKIAVPQSETDIEALYTRRQDIRDQLSSLSGRRHSLVEEIRSAPAGVARTGIEQRVTLLDQNIMQLEQELNSISMRLDAAPSELLHDYREPPSASRAYDNGWEEGAMSGFAMTMVAIGIIWVFRRWRGKKKRKGAPAISEAAESPRLERLEQGMEAIAIEVERISEGQRFMTKILSESRDPVAARIAQPAQGAER